MLNMSGDELGWAVAVGFAVLFAALAGFVAYYLSRTR
jgi:hypothetical protein